MRRNDVVCSVHERPDHAAELQQRADELVFLRDGFSLPVAILPPVALIYRRAWLATLVYLALATSIVVGLDAARRTARQPICWHCWCSASSSASKP